MERELQELSRNGSLPNHNISESRYQQRPLDPETEIFFCIKQKHLTEINKKWIRIKKAFRFKVNRTLKLDEMVRIRDNPHISGLDPLFTEVQLDKRFKEKDERVASEMFQKTQLIDLLILMLITLGTAISLVSYNLEFKGDFGFLTYVFLISNLGFSVVCCLFVVMRENLYLKMSKNKGTAKATDNLASTGRYKIVLLECVLIMIHPSPFFVGRKRIVFNESKQQEIYYYLNDYFQIFSLVRFTYFLSSAFNISIWKSRSAHRICKLYECEGGVRFTVKSLMKVNPSIFNIVLFVVTMALFT